MLLVMYSELNMYGKTLPLLISCFMISGIFGSINAPTEGIQNDEMGSLLQSHDPISIDNSTDFLDQALAEGWSGSGIPSDPLIISGYEIDATDNPYGIYIANTSLSFMIQGCSINDSVYVSEPYNVGAGIHLYKVTNCTVKDVEVSNCVVGILSEVEIGDVEVIGCSVHDNDAGAFAGYCQKIINVSLLGNNFTQNDCFGDPCYPGGGVRLFGYDNETAVINVIAMNNIIDNNHTSGGLFRVGDFGDGEISDYGNYVPLRANVTLKDNWMAGGSGGALKLLARSKLVVYADNNTILNGGTCSNRIGYNPQGYFVEDLDCTLIGNTLGRNDSDLWGDSFKLLASDNLKATITDNRISNTSYGSLRVGWACGEIKKVSRIVNAVIKGNDIRNCRGGGVSVISSERLDTAISSNRLDNVSEGYPGGGERNAIEVIGLDSCAVNAHIRDNIVNDSINNGIYLTGNVLAARGIIGNNRIEGGHSTMRDHVGIEVNNSIGTEVFGNTIRGMTDAGIRITDSQSATVTGNVIGNISKEHNAPYHDFGAVVFRNTNRSEVYGNDMENVSIGIHLLSFSSRNRIANNSVWNYQGGIFIRNGSDNNSAVNNTYEMGEIGIIPGYFSSNNSVSGDTVGNSSMAGVVLVSSKDIQVMNCLITESQDAAVVSTGNQGCEFFNNTMIDQKDGVYTLDSRGLIIQDNTILQSNGSGLFLDNSDGFEVFGNLIRNSTEYGVKCAGSGDLTIHHNALLYNNGTGEGPTSKLVQAYDDTDHNRWNQTSGGNYWLDWTWPDSDRDRIVDNPYDVMGNKSAKDRKPLVYSPVSPTPTDVRAKPGDGAVYLGWSIPIFKSYWEVEYVNIYRGTSIDTLSLLNTIQGEAYEYEDESAINGIEYVYRVSLFTTGGEGVPSDPVYIEPDGTNPDVVIISPGEGELINTREITMEWEGSDSSSGIRHYEVRLQSYPSYIDVGLNTSYVFGNLTEGIHTAWLRATDNASNRFETKVSFKVDLTLPDLNIITPLNGSYLSTESVNVTWNVEDGSGISSISISLDDKIAEDVTDEFYRNYNFLDEGAHKVDLQAVDRAGNVNSTTLYFDIDNYPPVATILSPEDGTYFKSGAGINISWSGSDNGTGIQRFLLKLDNNTWMEMGYSDGWFVREEAFTEGEHRINLWCEDMAGNRIQVVRTFIVDGTPPEVTRYLPYGDSVSPGDEIMVSFSEKMMTDEVEIIVSDLNGTILFDGQWYVFAPDNVPEAGKEYDVIVMGSDLAGNQMEPFSWSFTISGDLVQLKGRVVDTRDRVLEGIGVEIVEKEKEDVTNGNGLFSFMLEPGDYTLRISREGYVPYTKKVVIKAHTDMDLGDVVLSESGAGNGIVTGYVIDQNGEPIANAEIYIDGERMAATDTYGYFIINDLSSGTHQLEIRKSGFRTYEKEIEVEPDTQLDLDEVKLKDETDGPNLIFWALISLLIIAFIIILVVFLTVKSRVKEEEESWDEWEE